MSSENAINLTQDEIDRVLNNVRHDNEENDAPAAQEISLSQAELDALFGGNTKATYVKDSEVPAVSDEVPAPADKAAKIAARKAKTAALLAKVNASSPKRVSVVYGTMLGAEEQLHDLAAGSFLELDRLSTDSADIFIDGKLFAHGRLGSLNGHAAVRITEIM